MKLKTWEQVSLGSAMIGFYCLGIASGVNITYGYLFRNFSELSIRLIFTFLALILFSLAVGLKLYKT